MRVKEGRGRCVRRSAAELQGMGMSEGGSARETEMTVSFDLTTF